jgi:hypothetical protein
MYILKSDYDLALADFTQTIRIDPNYPDAKYFLEQIQKRGR